MEEQREDDVRLVIDRKELQTVIAKLQREILRLDALCLEQKSQLLKKRQRESNARRSVAHEKGNNFDKIVADGAKLRCLMAIKSRLVTEAKVMQGIKPTINENVTLANLNLEKELKETSEGLKTLTEVAEQEAADLKATLKRLDIVTNRDKLIAEALQNKIEEKMLTLSTGPEERANHRIRVLKANIRKAKRSTVEAWDDLAEFLNTNFPSMPRNERNASMAYENRLPQQYAQLSDTIQQLMNAHTSKTDNSYLKISDTWNPSYVKMLLGRGICVQDPQRPDYVRLEPYL